MNLSNSSHLSGISRRAFLRTGAVLGAGLGASALAACSSNGSSAGGSDAGTTKITFCLDYTPNTNHTGVYVAQAKGWYAEEGLEVEIVQPAEDTAEAMIGTGQAQFGVSYQDYLANSYDAGNTGLLAVAAIVQHNTSGIMSPAELGVTSARAMEGLRYATWDLPVEQATIRQVVEKDGGDYDKVILVPYTVDDEIAGFKADMFDTVWVYEGWAVQNAIVQGFEANYFSFISIDEVFDYYTPVIAANTEFCEKNPEVAKAFMRAVKRGYEFAVENPVEAGDLLCEAVPELDPELVAQSQAYLSGQYVADAEGWGVIEGGRWSAYYKWLNDNGLVENELDVDFGWTMDYLEK